MAHKVINKFIDTQDNDTKYEVGDTYPKTSKKPTKKRIDELSKIHPRYKRKFIEQIDEEPSPKKE